MVEDSLGTGRPGVVVDRVAGVEVGTGVADGQGRVLWVDDAFSLLVGCPPSGLVGGMLPDVLGLEPAEMSEAATGGALVRVSADGTATQRVTALVGRGWTWALIVELAAGRDEPAGTGRRPSVVVFALDGDGNLAAVWGAHPELIGLGPSALGEPVAGPAGEEPLFTDLVRRALDGRPARGLVVRDTASVDLHLVPAEGPEAGRPGVVGIALTIPAAARPHPGPLERQSALTGLARTALEGADAGPLLEETARVVHRALGARSCAIFEHLPDRRSLLLRAAVDWPDSAPQVVLAAAAPDPGNRADTAPGSLVTPIGGSPVFGYLVLRLEEDRTLTAEETRFAVEAADILAVALRRLSAEGRQRHAALHDPLTGLPNRALILDHLHLALARAMRQPSPLAVLFVDLGRFKVVNDTFGHDVGDELLVAVAERLAGVLRPSDTLGRLGGDEFLVVCDDLAGEAEAMMVAQRLAAAFDEPFALRRFALSATASIGVALSHADPTEATTLLAEADAAMYRAKQRSGTGVVLFDAGARPGPARPQEPGRGPEGRLDELVSRLAGLLEGMTDADPLDLREPPSS